MAHWGCSGSQSYACLRCCCFDVRLVSTMFAPEFLFGLFVTSSACCLLPSFSLACGSAWLKSMMLNIRQHPKASNRQAFARHRGLGHAGAFPAAFRHRGLGFRVCVQARLRCLVLLKILAPFICNSSLRVSRLHLSEATRNTSASCLGHKPQNPSANLPLIPKASCKLAVFRV